ncbi:MAG: hypothetical protein NVS3B7_18740 [Candidatus Elarobacter sp.]
MTNRFPGAAVLVAALVGAVARAASAAPVETTLAITVNPLSGHHEINGNHVDKLNFAPLPLGEATLRRGSESIRAEGLPGVTFGYAGGGDGAQSTRLSIVNATFRHAFGHGIFAGLGQTVYNQFTTYAAVRSGFFYTRGILIDPIYGSEEQYSRVTGLRFEAGQTIQLKRDRIEYWAAVNPKMHGVQYTRIPTSYMTCAGPVNCAQVVDTFADPENATQVDLSARVAHRISKHGEVLYGLRYLNYNAHYDDYPGQLADRNVGFAPTLGIRIRL